MIVYATELAAPADQLAGWGFRVVIDEARADGHDVRYVPLYGGKRGNRPDVWLLSLPYAGDAWRLVDFFDLAGEELASHKRSDATHYMMGGHGVANPEPFRGILDSVFLGEADGAVAGLLDALPDTVALSELSGIDTWTQPTVEWRAAPDPSGRPPYFVRSTKPGVGDVVYLEVARGCRQRCAFCEVGWALPYWERGRREALELARRAEQEHGVQAVLSAPDTDGVSWFAGAVETGDYSPRWRSTRVRPYLRAPEAESHSRGRIRFGVEGVTERLRKLVGKPITDADLGAALRKSQREGYRMGRVFLIAGLPTETTMDRRHAGELLRLIQAAGFRHWKACDVKVTPLSPQPFTPMGRLGIRRAVDAAREWRTVARMQAARDPIWRSVMVDKHSTEADVVKRMGRFQLLTYLLSRPRGEPGRQPETRRAVERAGIDYSALVLEDIGPDDPTPWSRVVHPNARRLGVAERAVWRQV